MSLQQKIKSLVCSLNEHNILKLFQSIELVLNQKIQINCRVISYKFYEATINFNVLKSNGYGRSDVEAINNCKKNFLELLVEDENAVPLFKNALRKIQAEQSKTNQSTSIINTSVNQTQLNQSVLNNTAVKEGDLKYMNQQDLLLNQSHDKKDRSFNTENKQIIQQSNEKKGNYKSVLNNSQETRDIYQSLENKIDQQQKHLIPSSMSILKNITQNKIQQQQSKPNHAPKSNSLCFQKNESFDGHLNGSMVQEVEKSIQKQQVNYRSEKQLICCSHESQLQIALSKIRQLEEKIKLLNDENKLLKSIYVDKSNSQQNQLNLGTEKKNHIINSNEKNSYKLESDQKNYKSFGDLNQQSEQQKNEYQSNKTEYQNQQILKTSQINNKPPSHSIQSQFKPNKENLNTEPGKEVHQKLRSISYDFQGIKQNIMKQKEKLENNNHDLNVSSHNLNNVSYEMNKSREGSIKKTVPKLNLNKIPNFHGNFQTKVLPQYNIYK